MPVSIKNRWNGEVIATVEDTDDLREAVIRLVRKGVSLQSANLRDSNLSDSDLRGSDLRGSDLSDSDLRGSDLSDSDLRDSNLSGSNLSDSDLSGSDLSGSDLSGIEKHIAVPSLHRKILAAVEGGGGTLNMSNWHTCETTHCRAGWAIHLAGAAGAVLEYTYGPSVAGALITRASCPQLNGKTPDFLASNEDALADIKRCAELEPPLEAPCSP